MTEAEQQTGLPCPFCGSDELLSGSWYIDDGEVDAWECSKCFAGAPKSAWNTRHGATDSVPDDRFAGLRRAIAAEEGFCNYSVGHEIEVEHGEFREYIGQGAELRK
jgi:ribosomal protein L37AE/L43A